MSDLYKKILPFLFICYAVLFIISLVYGQFFCKPPEELLKIYIASWRFQNSLQFFIAYLLVVHLSAVLIAMCTAADAEKQSHSHAGNLMRILVFFLGLTVCFIFLRETLLPVSITNQNVMLNKSLISKEYRNLIDQYKAEKKWKEAYFYLTLYFQINKMNQKIADELLELKAIIEKNKKDKNRENTLPFVSDNADAAGLEDIARNYFNSGDYHSAYYFATLSYHADDSRVNAKHLAAEAWEKLKQLSDVSDVQQGKIFKKKQEALQALTSGNPMAAYTLLKELKIEAPQDPEIENFYNRCLDDLRKIAFFKEEISSIDRFPAYRNITFRNKKTKDRTEMIHFDKMYQIQNEYYMLRIEGIAFSAENAVLYHFTAPYGKMSDHTLILQCMDRNTSEIYMPLYTIDTVNQQKDLGYLIRIEPDIQTLKSCSVPASNSLDEWQMKNFLELHQSQIKKQFGYSTENFQIELLFRTLQLFTFFILSLAFTSIGLSLRHQKIKKGVQMVLSVLFFILVPPLTALLTDAYFYFHKLLIGFFVFSFPFIFAVILFLAVQAAQMFFALFSLSKKIND